MSKPIADILTETYHTIVSNGNREKSKLRDIYVH